MAAPPHLETQIASFLDQDDRARAVEVALRGYGPQILSYLQTVLRSNDDGAEAFSLFCENVWTGIDRFARRSTWKAWAYKVAWHSALRIKQDPERRRRAPLRSQEAAALAAEVRSVTAPYLLTRNKDQLAALRESLEPDEQTLLILRIDRELSWPEIADVLAADGEEVSETTLRKRFERIKERLRTLAIESGLLPSS